VDAESAEARGMEMVLRGATMKAERAAFKEQHAALLRAVVQLSWKVIEQHDKGRMSVVPGDSVVIEALREMLQEDGVPPQTMPFPGGQ